MRSLFLFFSLILFTLRAGAADLRGRMGIGASNQLANGLPAISFKVQQSKTFALGGLVGFRSDENHSLFGGGVKFYRIIFDEPQLNFYMAGLFASQNYVDSSTDKVKSGYQVDGTLGSEFHFAGIESIGFSFEFGVSARNANSERGTSIETLGDQIVKAGVHFYL